MNVHVSEALEFVVGGKENSWHVPSAPDSLNAWAEKERFKTGDVLGIYFFFKFLCVFMRLNFMNDFYLMFFMILVTREWLIFDRLDVYVIPGFLIFHKFHYD